REGDDMLLEDELKQLEKTSYEGSKKVFSIYLNTDPRDPNQQGGKWEIKLKNALKDLTEQTKDSDSHEEKNQAKEICEKIEKEIYGKKDKLKRGFILFATADEELWFSKDLNIPVNTEFHWDNHPHVDQLQMLVSTYPHTGVLRSDSDSHEEKNQAKEICEKIEKEIYGKKDKLKRGFILFATADEELWFSKDLNIPVNTEFHWDNHPHVDQLQMLVSTYPHTGVL